MYTNKMLRIKYTVLILFTKVRDKSENGGSALQQAALGIETKRKVGIVTISGTNLARCWPGLLGLLYRQSP